MSDEPIRKKKAQTPIDSSLTGEFDFGSHMRAAADKKFEEGHSAISLSSHLRLPGISLKGKFVLQYLIGADVLPFNREINLQGKPGEGKSTAGWIISEMIKDNGGFTAIVETEDKTNVSQVEAILGMTKAEIDRKYNVFPRVKSTEAMLTKMTWCMEYFRDNAPRQHPCLLMVDSFSQPTSEKVKDQVKKDGVAATGFKDAQKAKTITDTAKATDDLLNAGPFIKILIHQEKIAIDTSGGNNWGGNAPPPEKSTVGGIGKDFKSSLTFGIEKKKRTNSVMDGSRTLHKWRGIKIGTGLDKRAIPVVIHDRMITPPNSEIPEGEDPVMHRYQKISVDWGYSLIKLFDEIFKGYNNDGISVAELKDITGLGLTGTKAWSSKFGIKQSEAVSWSAMGDFIQGDDEMIAKLQKIMHIDHHMPWDEMLKPRYNAQKKLKNSLLKMEKCKQVHEELKEAKGDRKVIAAVKKKMLAYESIAKKRAETIPPVPFYDPLPSTVVRKKSKPTVRRNNG